MDSMAIIRTAIEPKEYSDLALKKSPSPVSSVFFIQGKYHIQTHSDKTN
ncbi:MAG: hypothetical protein ACJA0M_001409 [Chitinophagales bacterium]|jgi:hypothetical protein